MSKKIKTKVKFCCSECGTEHPKWYGKCNGCGAWNTLVEFDEGQGDSNSKKGHRTMAGGSGKPININDVREQDFPGFSTYIGELDRVLGGKCAHGSLTLIAGEPGKGKSTLLLQAADKISKHVGKVLYCTGEESTYQIKQRRTRLGLDSDNLFLYNVEDITEIQEAIEELNPVFVIIDSIQHIYDPNTTGEQGSTKQVKACTSILVSIAKRKGTSVFIVGHVNKDDEIAGPRKLEHMVDTVLYLEGDKQSGLRYVLCRKNRYGSDSEVAIFRMGNEGMIEVVNPSEYLIANRSEDDSGSAIVCLSGKRPMLIEVQALVAKTGYEGAIPRRTSRGFARDEFNIIVAVLEKKCGVPLGSKDIYLNVVGGMDLEEPGVHLGVAMSIVSSERDIVIDSHTAIIGEIGLSGEVRPVANIEGLVKEAERNGFKQFVLPNKNMDDAIKVAKNIKLIPVKKVAEAIHILLPKKQ